MTLSSAAACPICVLLATALTIAAAAFAAAPKEAHAAGALTVSASYNIVNEEHVFAPNAPAKMNIPSITLGNGATLYAGEDYTVKYKNNKRAGWASATVKLNNTFSTKKKLGLNLRTGIANIKIPSLKFPIEKASLTMASISVKNVKYTGKAVKPKVTVKYRGKTLKKNRDYTVSYKNNRNPGTGTVTVKGHGNYKDTATCIFQIKDTRMPTVQSKKMSNLAKREFSRNKSRGGSKYWKYCGFDRRVEWCSCFAKWCWDKSGQQAKLGGPADYPVANSWLNWANANPKNARIIEYKKGYKPMEGDILVDGSFGGFKNSIHVGIAVSKLSSGKFLVVEGNNGDKITKKKYKPSSGRWDWVVRPT